jgi:hypothetical protein
LSVPSIRTEARSVRSMRWKGVGSTCGNWRTTTHTLSTATNAVRTSPSSEFFNLVRSSNVITKNTTCSMKNITRVTALRCPRFSNVCSFNDRESKQGSPASCSPITNRGYCNLNQNLQLPSIVRFHLRIAKPQRKGKAKKISSCNKHSLYSLNISKLYSQVCKHQSFRNVRTTKRTASHAFYVSLPSKIF